MSSLFWYCLILIPVMAWLAVDVMRWAVREGVSFTGSTGFPIGGMADERFTKQMVRTGGKVAGLLLLVGMPLAVYVQFFR